MYNLSVLLRLTLVLFFAARLEALAQNPTPVDLGTATSFAALAYSGITNTGATDITGDLGSYPTTTITGLNQIALTGTNHGGDATTVSAVSSLLTAYNSAKGRAVTTPEGAVFELGGKTLPPGVYSDPTSFRLSDNLTLTLDAQGDPNAVWIFQAGTAVTTGTKSVVSLINGAQASRVFWQVGSSASLGTYSVFAGTIMAYSSVTLATAATLDGRALALHGDVTFQGNSVTVPQIPTTVAAQINLLFKERVMVETKGSVLVAPARPYNFQIFSPLTRIPATGPTGQKYPLVWNALDNQFEYRSASLTSLALLNTTFPDGMYTLGNGVTLHLADEIYPYAARIYSVNGVPAVWNSRNQLVVKAASALQLKWTPFTATHPSTFTFATRGYESVQLQGGQDSVNLLQTAFGPMGEADFQTFDLPAHYLVPGHTYLFLVNYLVASSINRSTQPGKTSAAGYMTQTYLTIVAE